jgi:hypothetical protein
MFAGRDARQSDEAMSTTVEQAAAKLDELVRRNGRIHRPPVLARGGGPSPFVVIGAAFVLGLLVARMIDWRSHAHPRA